MADLDLTDQLAADVLVMARLGHMPDTYWATDSRILRAREVLRLDSANAARNYADVILDKEMS